MKAHDVQLAVIKTAGDDGDSNILQLIQGINYADNMGILISDKG